MESNNNNNEIILNILDTTKQNNREITTPNLENYINKVVISHLKIKLPQKSKLCLRITMQTMYQ